MTIAESRFSEIKGFRTHYLEAGEGEPVILLHGGIVDSSTLSIAKIIEPIAKEYRVIAPDLPGYGLSDWPETTYTTEFYADFLRAFMGSLGIERASFFGTSVSGACALLLSQENPEMVDRLVLAGSYGLGSEIPKEALITKMMQMLDSNRTLWIAPRRGRVFLKQVLRFLIQDKHVITEELVEEAYNRLKQPRAAAAYVSWQENESSRNSSKDHCLSALSKVTTPTLILHGAHDRLIGTRWAKLAHATIGGSELKIYPRSGHWLPQEIPEAVASDVLRFLGKESVRRHSRV